MLFTFLPVFCIQGITPISISILSDTESVTVFNQQQIIESKKVKVYLHKADEVVDMDIIEYLCGVLNGEMPPTYEMEALKAQAVAAFTY
jgi:stage II sporulation protein D